MYQRGEVVLIPFPYTDLSANKTRPAIIVSSEHFHAARPEILLMYVSSQVEKANPLVDYLLQDWEEARLLKPSFARPKIAAVEPELVVHRVGVLSARDLRGVELCLVKAFGLEAALLVQINLAVQPATFVQALTERALAGAVAKAAAGEAGINLLLLREMLKTNQS